MSEETSPNGSYDQATQNPYGYVPNIKAGASFVALFGLATIPHLFLAFKSSRRYIWSIVFVVAGCGEILGWSARIASSLNIYGEVQYLIQIICLIMAPSFLSAGVYQGVGNMIVQLQKHAGDRKLSVLPAKAYTILFVTCDIIAIVLQGVGGSTAGKASDQQDYQLLKIATKVILAGIVFNLVATIIFLVLALIFFSRSWRFKDEIQAAGHASAKSVQLYRRFAIGEVLATICIIVRGIFRTVELSMGFKSFLAVHEVFTINLDGFPILLALFILVWSHPSLTLGPASTLETEATENKQ